MAEVTKYQLVPTNNTTTVNDVRTHIFSLLRTIRRSSTAFVYGVVLVFVIFAIFLSFAPSSTSPSSSPWSINIFTLNSSYHPSSTFNEESYRSHFSYIFPNLSETDTPQSQVSISGNLTKTQVPPNKDANNTSRAQNVTVSQVPISIFEQKQRKQSVSNTQIALSDSSISVNSTKPQVKEIYQSVNSTSPRVPMSENSTESQIPTEKAENFEQKQSVSNPQKGDDLISSLVNCDLYDGNWVRDESYPLYKTESCSFVDEQFRCLLNGRPDSDYQKLRWKPKGCSLPRLNAKDMLERLRGKRMVFVGDSLNRNMWESLVCILENSVENKNEGHEGFGRHHFKDYDCSVDFFVAPFLVQPWKVQEKKSKEMKKTLQLDIVVKESVQFKDADFLIFNTGHWWTHEKTSKGEDFYQEGNHVYKQLDVVEACRRAMKTWARWVDSNVNPKKTHVLFSGYSAVHYRGGQWNSGGSCGKETKPIENESYLMPYPWQMKVTEKVIKGMKTRVSYLNVTKMTDYRKDGHPSGYRKQNYFDLKVQDCSHWCLPGVPDSWNELLYAEILRKQF